jgi:hypothetical protein
MATLLDLDTLLFIKFLTFSLELSKKLYIFV